MFFRKKKYDQIVMTQDVVQGSPRLEGRRLSVGDIVTGVDINENLEEYLKDFELNIEQIKQCLDYCRTKQCVKDVPNKYCHNCTLRITQEDEAEGNEEENWIRAEKLFSKLFPQDKTR